MTTEKKNPTQFQRILGNLGEALRLYFSSKITDLTVVADANQESEFREAFKAGQVGLPLLTFIETNLEINDEAPGARNTYRMGYIPEKKVNIKGRDKMQAIMPAPDFFVNLKPYNVRLTCDLRFKTKSRLERLEFCHAAIVSNLGSFLTFDVQMENLQSSVKVSVSIEPSFSFSSETLTNEGISCLVASSTMTVKTQFMDAERVAAISKAIANVTPSVGGVNLTPEQEAYLTKDRLVRVGKVENL